MNTPTHLLVAATALARRNAPVRNAVVFAGALLPDLSIFILYFWSKFVEGLPSREIWRVIYWQEPWQTISAISNSFPIWGLVAAIGLAIRQPLLAAFGAAGLLHLAFDFPFHNSDAHKHFWPLTDWRFNSPLSYWDHRHHGDVVGYIEVALAIVLIFLLWRRFSGTTARAILILALATYIAVPMYFWMTLG